MGIDKTTIDRIVDLHNAGKSCEEIAEMIGLSESTVRAIVKP